MNIEWNKVTWVSQIVAIVLFVAVFFVGFIVGRRFENKFILGTPVARAQFACADSKIIHADFYSHLVHLELAGGRVEYLPQTISADGSRYANDDESVVFWNRGNTAFMTEGASSTMTYKDCVVVSQSK